MKAQIISKSSFHAEKNKYSLDKRTYLRLDKYYNPISSKTLNNIQNKPSN